MQVLVQRAQVWYAQVPYNDVVDESKVRPVVVVGWTSFGPRDDHNILVVPSSTFSGDSSKAKSSDLVLTDWAVAGLSAASHLRAGRLMTLAPQMILWTRGLQGTLARTDWEALLSKVELFFATPQMAVVPGASTS